MNTKHVDEMQIYFSNATQDAFALVGDIFNQFNRPTCDLNDLYYFGCVFLSVLTSRLSFEERQIFKDTIHEILNTAAQDGKKMCQQIISANLTTKEDRNYAMKNLIDGLKGSNNADSSVLTSIASEIRALGMTDDGIWKDASNMKYETQIENAFRLSFEDFITQVIREMPQSKNPTASIPELCFLVNAAMSVGLMVGHISILYRQSLEESIAAAMKKINESIDSYENNLSALH